MTATLDHLMDNLRISIPGALDGVLKMELYNVVDEFCKRTNAWQEDVEFLVSADRTEYDIEPFEAGSQLLRLMHTLDENDKYVVARMPDPSTLILRDDPGRSATFVARVALTTKQPERASDGYPYAPAWFFEQYTKELMNGVRARMHAQLAKPYSSQQLAVQHARLFAHDCTLARQQMIQERVYDGQAWRFPSFTGR
jgi:hypothetical protein